MCCPSSHLQLSSNGGRFLVLDPHYTGRDDLRTVISKVCLWMLKCQHVCDMSFPLSQGWCGWKPASFWDKKV